jgi:hypothetical protein
VTKKATIEAMEAMARCRMDSDLKDLNSWELRIILDGGSWGFRCGKAYGEI